MIGTLRSWVQEGSAGDRPISRFYRSGFQYSIDFRHRSTKVGTKIGDYVVKDSKDLIRTVQEAQIKIAMVAVPISQAQAVAESLVKAGVEPILSYAPISLNVPAGVHVQYIDPSIHLQRMTYYFE